MKKPAISDSINNPNFLFQTSSLPVRDVLEELSDENTNENNLDQTADIDNKAADCINVDLGMYITKHVNFDLI